MRRKLYKAFLWMARRMKVPQASISLGTHDGIVIYIIDSGDQWVHIGHLSPDEAEEIAAHLIELAHKARRIPR